MSDNPSLPEPAGDIRTDSSASRSLHSQAARFLAVGVLCALMDYGTYRLLLHAGLPVALAKAGGFVVGTTATYLINRSFTFGHTGGRQAVLRFVMLYAVTLLLNVATNALLLRLLTGVSGSLTLAWVVAQAVTSAANFVGMRYVVFR